VRVFVGVEGPNDIEFLCGISSALRRDDGSIPDLEAAAQDGSVLFVPLGGSTLAVWCDRLAALNRPEVYLVDRDFEPPLPSKYGRFVEQWRLRPNCSAFETSYKEMENYLHPDAIAEVNPTARVTWGPFVDIPQAVARAIHEAAPGARPWDELDEADVGKKKSKAKKWLNAEGSRKMTLKRLKEIDGSGELAGWLRGIGQHL
jgi:hypothetical protein